MTAFALYQTLMPNGRYRLDKEIVYYSPRYKKTITVPVGYPSDGATGAFDTVSRYWWVHDLLCDRGTFDDGTELTNWQCSQVLQDILVEESKMFQGRERAYVWIASRYRFWATWFIGGGKCRENGMW